jgi:hypothetical protein
MANKQRAEDIDREEARNAEQVRQWSRQHALNQSSFAESKRQFAAKQAMEERKSEVGMGLEAGKLGVTMASKGGKTLGDIWQGGKELGVPGMGAPGTGFGSAGGFMSNLNIGQIAGGGLAGYGMSKMLGKKASKVTKGLAGAGVGAALGLLGGGNAFSGMLSGGFGGGIGGLFG